MARSPAETEIYVKRILIPVHWLTDFGGLHENVLDTAEGLIAGGWQVTVMAPPSKATARFVALGAKVLEDSMDDIASSTSLAVSQGPFDLVHAHPFQAREVGFAVAEALRIPLVVTLHLQYEGEFERYSATVRRVICVSGHLSEHVARACPQLADKLVTIPNGVDFDIFRPPDTPVPRGDRTIIGIASRLDPDKQVLCNAVADLVDHLAATGAPNQFELRIAGERLYGPPSNSFVEAIDRAAASGVVAVTRLGWISDRRALRNFFTEANVIVAPGRAAMEAIACGTPTIAADALGYVGLVTAGSFALGHLTNFGGVREAATRYSPGAIVEDLYRALAMTPKETAKLRQKLKILHDVRSIQTAQLELCNHLYAATAP